MMASEAVTFRSFVGGLKPNTPMMLAMPMYRITVIRYGTYFMPASPITPLNRLLKVVIMVSSTSCFLPGFSTLRFLTRIIDNSTSTAIMIHVTTTDSVTGIPPNIGIVNTVLHWSSLDNSSARSVRHHFLSHCFIVCQNAIPVYYWFIIEIAFMASASDSPTSTFSVLIQ